MGSKQIGLELTVSKPTHVFFALLFMVVSCHVNAGLVQDQVLATDDRNRTYDVFSSDGFVRGARPVVILRHGYFGDANVVIGKNGKKALFRIWMSIAEREDWFRIIPDGEIALKNAREWNGCREDSSVNPSTDDVKYTNTLIDTVGRQHPIDRSRVYVYGISNGGTIVYRLSFGVGAHRNI